MVSSVARAPLGRQQLLDAARAELLNGNGGMDIGSVVRRAALTTGALYHHFGSKTGLLAAVYDDFYEGLDRAIADTRLPKNATWAQRERRRTRHMVAYHYAEPLAAQLLDRAATDPQLTLLESAYVERLSEAAARNIRHGQQLGQLPTAIDPDVAGAYIIGGLRRGIAQQLRARPRPSLDHAAERLWHLVAATLDIA